MPYPYTLTPDGHTLEPEDVVKPPAETQEESTSTHSPHLDFGNPLPPMQQPPPTEQSTGQASSSDSGEQGSTGSSQTEDSTDADRAKDEKGAQDALLDFEDVQEDYLIAGLVAGLGPNRLPEYSNLDVLRVKQDIEARPLTYELCIRQSPSLRSACEFIYADPDDVGGVQAIGIAWRLFQGQAGASGGSSGDARNDVAETFTLYDVRQFTEIDLTTAALDEDEAEHYEIMLETVFKFDIEWGNNDENRLNQLQNLAKANVHIVDYLDHVIAAKPRPDPEVTGLSVYRQHFSQTDAGPLRVSLGADSVLVEVFNLEGEAADDARYLGNVPLKASASGEELDKVYLGSEVNIATITHEFMHVLDRNTGITEDIFDHWVIDTLVPPDTAIHKYVIKGFAAKQTAFAEIWADIGVTAVLDLAASDEGRPFQVFSVKATLIEHDDGTVTYPYLEKLTLEDVFGCRDDSCEFRDVGWRDTRHASSVKAYMIDLFWEELVLRT